MYKKFVLLSVLAGFLFFRCTDQVKDNSGISKWVYKGEDGKLEYGTTEKGDRILDFSHAGYMGGGVVLPDVPVKITLQSSNDGSDRSDEIQEAVDQVAGLPEKDGIRGAVLLAPGEFVCSKTIVIHTSGVVLRGSGQNENGTTIRMTGPKHPAFIIGSERGRGSWVKITQGNPGIPATGDDQTQFETHITDNYVPSGTSHFTVADATGFATGDWIAISRPVTAAWISLLQMDILTRDGAKQRWISAGSEIEQYREIKGIDGNIITVKVPLSDSFDSHYLNPPGVKVTLADYAPAVINSGIENLHVQCPPLEINFRDAPYSGVSLLGDHCWVRDVYFEETMNTIRISGNYNTIQRVRVTHTYPNLGAAKPADFSFNGTHNLIDRCEAVGGNTYFVWTSSRVPGPNVLLNSTFRGHGSRIQPHQRWATGLLVDNCTILDGGIDFLNRGAAGSGQGWSMGWAVAWNCLAKFYTIQNPPGSKNWAIGCIGEIWRTPALFNTAPIMPDGEFDSHEKPVSPQSLYLAQLAERLGEEALKNIGYTSNSIDEFTNKNEQPSTPLKSDIDPVLGEDLGVFRSVNASNRRNESRTFAAEKALDANADTYWATEDGIKSATITIDTEGPLNINAVSLDEADIPGSRVLKYRLEAQVDSDWKLLSEGTTIGKNKIDRFPETTVWKVRLTIVESENFAAISKFGLYLEKR